MKICTALVTYNKYNNFDWMRICVESYKNIFPDHQMVVVDHNRNREERKYLLSHKNLILLENPKAFDEKLKYWNTHGIGLDCATEWAKQNAYDAIVFIEPDCLITGPQWYENLVKQIESGKSLASIMRWHKNWSGASYHPCGSIWRLLDIPGSFDIFYPGENPPWVEKHPNIEYWDTGGRNWYFMHPDKVGDIIGNEGIIHFIFSAKRSAAQACIESEWYKKLLEDRLKISYAKYPTQPCKFFL